MSVIRLPNGWKPRDYQRPLWDYLENGGKRAVEVAHRRWGKDEIAILMELVDKIVKDMDRLQPSP